MIEIVLPWPDKALSPNSRGGWGKIKAIRQARKDAYYITLEAIGICCTGENHTKYKTQYKFYPPDRRWRDRDNCSAMMKAAQDGVADALRIDDVNFIPEKPEWGDVVKGGKVVLTLEELE